MILTLFSAIYFANIHCHTALSDGEGTVEEAFTYARDSAKIDILVITDHTHMIEPSSFNEAKKISQKFRDGFLGIYGQEFGSLNDFGSGHIGVLNADSVIPVDEYDLQGTYSYLYSHNLVANFHHPFEDDFEDFKYYDFADSSMNLLEIINKDYIFEDKFIEALNKGWHVSPVANQDNHHKQWGDEESGGRIPLTGIIMDSLTYSSFVDAVRKRRTYAFQESPEGDRIYMEFYVDGILMGGIENRKGGIVELRVSLKAVNDFDSVYLFKNGEIIETFFVGSSQLEKTFVDTLGNSSYYFIKAVQKDGDLVYSAPVWINYVPAFVDRVKIIPNPASEHVKFEVEDFLSGIDVLIYDMEGNLIVKENKMEWDLRNREGRKVKKGIYFVVIKGFNSAGENKKYRDKIWVQ